MSKTAETSGVAVPIRTCPVYFTIKSFFCIVVGTPVVELSLQPSIWKTL